ncbi:hypothetical protein D3C86_1295360 [compost metagenome]
MQRNPFTPGLQHLGDPGNLVLPQLVATGGSQQQRDDVGLFDAQRLRLAGQLVAQAQVLQLVPAGDPVQLMQLQPQPFRYRTIKLGGADQRPVQAMDRTLQRQGQHRCTVLAESRSDAHDNLFIANRQVILQRLAEVGDLARSFVEDDRLMQEMPLQVLADVIHLGP